MAIKNDIIALLQEVEQGKYSNIVLNELFHKKSFQKGEKNFITEVFYGVIRNKIYLDYMISQKVKEIKKDETGATWVKIPSGWICAITTKGEVYLK